METENNPKKPSPIQANVSQRAWHVVPGETIVISAFIENHSDEGEILSVSVEGIPAAWVPKIDPIRLLPRERKEIQVRVSPPRYEEDIVGRYPLKITVVRSELPERPVHLEGTLTVAAYVIEGPVGLLMESLQYAGKPGGKIEISFILVNQGQTEDTFGLSVKGIPQPWIHAPSPSIQLDPKMQHRMTFFIQPPRRPESRAGRHEIVVRIASQKTPMQYAEVTLTMTVEAFSDFNMTVAPSDLSVGENLQVRIENKGNIPEVYTIDTSESTGDMRIEMLPLDPHSNAQVVDLDTQISSGWGLRVPAGQTGVLTMIPRLKFPHLVGRDRTWRLEVKVTPGSGAPRDVIRNITGKALLPNWVLPVSAIAVLVFLCVLTVSIIRRPIAGIIQGTGTANALLAPSQTIEAIQTNVAAATQSAAFALTLTAGPGLDDLDADGLTYDQEIQLGTDPDNPDTDGDELLDGEEVLRTTNPLNPDTDADGLTDGKEIALGTDPLKPDTDGDGLLDGREIEIGTNPNNPDTDNDGLTDGQETPPCPDPLKPDTDGDGFIDSQDQNPCEAGTATPPPTGNPPSQTPTQPVPPTVTATGAPPFPGNVGKIVFVSDRDGNQEIYILNTADNSLLRLTNNNGADTQPSASPNGSKIAFVSNRDGNREIYVMNADGSGLVNVTNNAADDRDPTWSPDGTKIAFTSNRDGNDDIFIMDANGANLLNFTNHPSADSQPDWYQGPAPDFAWSIVFTTDRDGNREIYGVRTDGVGLANLTNNSAEDYAPAAYPSGNLLAFVSERDGNAEIYVTSLIPGATQSNLTANSAADRSPNWSPDGKWIVFVTERDGNTEIYLIKVDNTGTSGNLTNHPGSDTNPVWLGP